jgi:hypothetical protein
MSKERVPRKPPFLGGHASKRLGVRGRVGQPGPRGWSSLGAARTCRACDRWTQTAPRRCPAPGGGGTPAQPPFTPMPSCLFYPGARLRGWLYNEHHAPCGSGGRPPPGTCREQQDGGVRQGLGHDDAARGTGARGHRKPSSTPLHDTKHAHVHHGKWGLRHGLADDPQRLQQPPQGWQVGHEPHGCAHKVQQGLQDRPQAGAGGAGSLAVPGWGWRRGRGGLEEVGQGGDVAPVQIIPAWAQRQGGGALAPGAVGVGKGVAILRAAPTRGTLPASPCRPATSATHLAHTSRRHRSSGCMHIGTHLSAGNAMPTPMYLHAQHQAHGMRAASRDPQQAKGMHPPRCTHPFLWFP